MRCNTHYQRLAGSNLVVKTQRDSDYTKLKDTRTNVSELQKIRKCVDIALRADQPEQSRAKRHEQER